MHLNSIFRSFAAVAAVLLGQSASAADPCPVVINKAPLAQRTVLLSDGNAWSLFQQYLGEAENRGVKLNLSKVKVVLVAKKEKKEYRVDWKQMITGDSKRDIWARQLRNVTADRDEAACKEAIRRKWDLVCYSGAEAKRSAYGSRSEQGRGGADGITIEAKQHFQQGMQYAAHRDFTNAGKEFSNAISKSPGYAAAYSNRGVAYLQQRKFDLAEDDLKKAVELGPSDGKSHYNLACWYALQGQTGRGLASIDAALANGFSDYQSLRKDKDLVNLRKSRDWQKTLEKHKVFLGSGK